MQQEAKPQPPPLALPPRLQTLLAGMTHRALAGKLERIYHTATLAMDRLSHLNIVKYEPATVDASDAEGLTLWEKMAPAIRDTVVDVNMLVAAVNESFPRTEPPEPGARWEPPPASLDMRLSQEVEVVLQACAARLARRVADLGQRMRRPELMNDAWALMAELQSFRSDFRTQMGDLVYLTAAAFADVRREEVVPGQAQQVIGLVALRRSAADLRRALLSRLEKVDPQRLPALAQRMEEMLGAFSSTPAALLMKTRDKRRMMELRLTLRALAAQPQLSEPELRTALEPFLQSMAQLGEELTGGLLALHDRTVWATCTGRLEQSTMHLFLGSPGAERVLRDALTLAEALYGRSETFDQLLRKARTTAEQGFTDESLRELLEVFRERLAHIPAG